MTNYNDKYVIISGGAVAEFPKPLGEVIKYDIEANKWSTCPKLLYDYINHSSLCVNGKLYHFFGQYVGDRDGITTLISSNVIEKLDFKAHISGHNV